MQSAHDLSKLIGTIYEAVGTVDDWPHVLDAVHRAFGSRGSQLLFLPIEAAPTLLNRLSASLHQDLCDEYYRDYFALDPRMTAVRRHFGKAMRCVDLVPRDVFEATPVPSFLNRADVDVRYALIAPFRIGTGSFGFLAVMRPENKGPYASVDVHAFELLLPHIRRVVELQMRLGELESRRDASEAALDHMAAGVVLVDAAARVLFANAAAERIMASGDGLIAPAQRLACRVHAEAETLQRAIRDAAQQLTPGPPGRSVVLASRSSGKLPLTLFVLPVPRPHGLGLLACGAVVAIFIVDPDDKPVTEIAAECLLRLFRMTPAEAKVALALAEGFSVAEIAAAHGTSRNTVRTQVQAVLEKTQTKRQAELVSLLAKLPRLARR